MQVENMQEEYKLVVCKQEECMQAVCKQAVCKQEECMLAVCTQAVCMLVVCTQEPWVCIRILDYQPPPQRQPRSKRRNSSSTSFRKIFDKNKAVKDKHRNKFHILMSSSINNYLLQEVDEKRM